MVYYLKVNRHIGYTIKNLQCWLNILDLVPDAKVYILCDNADLQKQIESEVDYHGLAPEFISSIKRLRDKDLMDKVVAPRWENAGYAHLTTFIHSKEHQYNHYWNIDADDTVFCLEFAHSAQLLGAIEIYADQHGIDLFSLDMWRSRAAASGGEHWSFGITYVNGKIDWLRVMRRNSTYCVPYQFFTYQCKCHPKNIDEFFTYVKNHDQEAVIETFCVKDLTFLHYSEDFLRNPITSSICHWTDSEVIFPILYYVYQSSSLGKIPISDDVVKLDLGIKSGEDVNFLAKTANFTIETINVIDGTEFAAEIEAQINRNISHSLTEIQKYEGVFLFGYSKYVEKVIDQLSSYQIKVQGILDNDTSKQGRQVCGIEIFSPELLKNRTVPIPVLIAIRYVDEVRAQLREMGFEGPVIKVIDYENLVN